MIHGNNPAFRIPDRRLLKAFAFDPMSTRLNGKYITFDVRFEPDLQPGPVGDLVEVIDYDASHNTWYQSVDLDDPVILASGGLTPTETDPRTHQQVVYAVAMSVIERFERFGGRRFRWRGNPLKILPHAFESTNAYFDPHPKRDAVLLGYFHADATDAGANLPGQMIYTCLSVDIVAHEVTHAIVHRLRRYFSEPTNVDVYAWHEGFADLVALFHHFVFKEVVSHALSQSGGNLKLGESKDDALTSIAAQFGFASGRGAALRQAVGTEPDPAAFARATEPHARGALFVAAVFDTYLSTFKSIVADLLRLATGGSGVLPAGALHPDMVKRLTEEAVRNADRVLGMIVRAFDYMPVVDVTFGDIVRAIVTADRSLYPDDALGLRSTLVESLRRRGITPTGVSSLAEESLTWSVPEGLTLDSINLTPLIVGGTQDLDLTSRASTVGDRPNDDDQSIWTALHGWGVRHARELGLDPNKPLGVVGGHVSFFRAADGQPRPIVALQFMQRREDLEQEHNLPVLRAGTTVIARLDGKVEYVVAKPLPLSDPSVRSAMTDSALQQITTVHDIDGEARLAAIRAWAEDVEAADPLAVWSDEPALLRLSFARMHAEESMGGN